MESERETDPMEGVSETELLSRPEPRKLHFPKQNFMGHGQAHAVTRLLKQTLSPSFIAQLPLFYFQAHQYL